MSNDMHVLYNGFFSSGAETALLVQPHLFIFLLLFQMDFDFQAE